MATQASDSIGQSSRTASADELAVIAQRAQAFTNASGSAIAISEGNSGEIICRARSGSSAPDVGTALRVEGSFTGLCIQSGKELRCDDAETDTRVDTSAIRALGIRSMVVTPIRDERRIVGVLAVFAPTAHAFTITHVAVLRTMADQISAFLQRVRLTKDEVPHAAPVPLPTPIAAAAPAPKLVKPAVPLPPPVVIKPAQASSTSAGLSVAPAPAPARPAVPTVPKIETRPVALAADIAPPLPIPLPRKEEKREHRTESFSAPKASLGTLDAVAGQPAKPFPGKIIFVVLLLAGLAAGGWAWFHFRTHSTSTASAPATQPQESSAPAGAAPPAATLSPASPAVNSNPTSSATPVTVASSSPKPSVSEKAESKKAEPKKETLKSPATVTIGDGPSRIAQAAPVDQSPDVAPTLAVGGGSSTGLASLARPVPSAMPSMISQSNLVNAKLIRTVQAVYPELAKARRIGGIVIIRVTVGKDGKVRNPVLVSGPVVFRESAFQAVLQWQFKPAELNGQIIEQETEVRMKFNE